MTIKSIQCHLADLLPVFGAFCVDELKTVNEFLVVFEMSGNLIGSVLFSGESKICNFETIFVSINTPMKKSPLYLLWLVFAMPALLACQTSENPYQGKTEIIQSADSVVVYVPIVDKIRN